MVRLADCHAGGSVTVQHELNSSRMFLSNLAESSVYCYFLDKQPGRDNIAPWLESHKTLFDGAAARISLSVRAGL